VFEGSTCASNLEKTMGGGASKPEAKLINKPEDVVCEMLEGLVAKHSHLSLLDGFEKVRRCHCVLQRIPGTQESIAFRVKIR
jgi:hypothetical protein